MRETLRNLHSERGKIFFSSSTTAKKSSEGDEPLPSRTGRKVPRKKTVEKCKDVKLKTKKNKSF